MARKEFTGSVESITIEKNWKGERVVLVGLFTYNQAPNTKVDITFNGGMVQRARALNPGDEVTITAEGLQGLSIIGLESVV